MNTPQKRTLDDIGSYLADHVCGEAKISSLLEKREGKVHTITQSKSVYDALEIMSEQGIGALVVVEEGLVVGVISERDYARKVILTGRASRDTTVREIMSWPAKTVSPEHTVSECMALMTEYRIRHLPVIDKGRLSGIVSVGDLVKAVIADQGVRLEQFEKYIRGTYPA
jgi:predicted transcriptional regulator